MKYNKIWIRSSGLMGNLCETDTLLEYKQHDNTPVRIDEEPPRWSGTTPPPAIGATVNVRINAFGPSTVLRYFTQHGFLGIVVRPHRYPDWFKKQNPRRKDIHVFGAEIS